jgi:hypothetical protein
LGKASLIAAFTAGKSDMTLRKRVIWQLSRTEEERKRRGGDGTEEAHKHTPPDQGCCGKTGRR